MSDLAAAVLDALRSGRDVLLLLLGYSVAFFAQLFSERRRWRHEDARRFHSDRRVLYGQLLTCSREFVDEALALVVWPQRTTILRFAGDLTPEEEQRQRRVKMLALKDEIQLVASDRVADSASELVGSALEVPKTAAGIVDGSALKSHVLAPFRHSVEVFTRVAREELGIDEPDPILGPSDS